MTGLEIGLAIACGVLFVGVAFKRRKYKALLRMAAQYQLGIADLLEDRRTLHAAVHAAHAVFNHYHALHVLKGTPEGNDKAAKNDAMAKTMLRALQLTDFYGDRDNV